jgi:hypothetical protein
LTRRDLGDLLLLAALWGASFLFMRMGAGEFGPLALSAVRVALTWAPPSSSAPALATKAAAAFCPAAASAVCAAAARAPSWAAASATLRA